MKLVPLQDRVVLKQLEAEEKTASGIILTGSAQEKPQEAEVIAVGPCGNAFDRFSIDLHFRLCRPRGNAELQDKIERLLGTINEAHAIFFRIERERLKRDFLLQRRDFHG